MGHTLPQHALLPPQYQRPEAASMASMGAENGSSFHAKFAQSNSCKSRSPVMTDAALGSPAVGAQHVALHSARGDPYQQTPTSRTARHQQSLQVPFNV